MRQTTVRQQQQQEKEKKADPRATVALVGLITVALFGGSLTLAGARAIEPLSVEPTPNVDAAYRGRYSESSLAVAVRVDREGAQVVAYTVKPRPFVGPLVAARPRGFSAHGTLQLEVALRGPDERHFTRRIDVGPICLDHGPDTEPHVTGDVSVPHREIFVVKLPQIAGFDRVEFAYYDSSQGAMRRRPIGETELEESRFESTAGPIGHGDPQLVKPRDGNPPAGTQGMIGGSGGSTVIWPEDVDDEDVYTVWGSEAETDRRIDVVILPDGYTYQQKTLLEADAQALVTALGSKTPYDEHEAFFNYTLVYAYSVESGNDECDCGTVVDNAFGTYFKEGGPCGSSLNRCIQLGPNGCDTDGSDNLALGLLRAPDHDYTVVMINTDRYGGCGGGRALYAAGHSQGINVAGHEIAHTIAGLADEYFTDNCTGQHSAGEVNTSTNETEGAWPEWIADIGDPWLGGQYKIDCIYRPRESCAMRSSSQPFCEVCNQRWALRIFGHGDVAPTAPVESAAPEACRRVDPQETVSFSVGTRFADVPAGGNSITWTLVEAPGLTEPVELDTDVTTYEHTFTDAGDYTIRCEVIADENFIKPVKFDANVDVVQWQYTAATTLAEDCNMNNVPDRCEQDCNDNGTPDDCEGLPDCDADGLPDECEADCNDNDIPDDCEGLDCDGNGILDECEPVQPCDDGVYCNGAETCTVGGCQSGPPPCTAGDVCVEPETACAPPCPEITCCDPEYTGECEPTAPPECTSSDTGNQWCAISTEATLKCAPATVVVETCTCSETEPGADCPGTFQTYACSAGPGGPPDCDLDGLPDACEEDCDGNGMPDDCEAGTDCDHDGVHDACETDCNANGIPDDCEKKPPVCDADGDGVPDPVDNCPFDANPGQYDADGDGVGSACDNCKWIVNPQQTDANGNGVGDVCECYNDADCDDGDSCTDDLCLLSFGGGPGECRHFGSCP